MIRLGRHAFTGPLADPDAIGRRRAGVLAVLEPATLVVEAVEAHKDLASGARHHRGRHYAVLYTDLYPSGDGRLAATARERLAAIVRDELAEAGWSGRR